MDYPEMYAAVGQLSACGGDREESGAPENLRWSWNPHVPTEHAVGILI